MKDFKETKKTISAYWTNKEDRKLAAKKHHTDMTVMFNNEIVKSVENSKIYGDVQQISDVHSPIQKFMNVDSTTAAFENFKEDKKICILNFASYKHPGGGYMNGSSAQEESLCHKSTLYEVLSSDRFKKYYDLNNKNLNRSLYLNRAIYSPSIVFIRNKKIEVDVLTCAAPNIGSAGQYQNVSDEENYEALKSRMQFIANILNENRVNIFIAGAFGCGVFGQSPDEVSHIWKNEVIYGKDLELIIHAVPGNNENSNVFKGNF